jgi:hypothetical protein
MPLSHLAKSNRPESGTIVPKRENFGLTFFTLCDPIWGLKQKMDFFITLMDFGVLPRV